MKIYIIINLIFLLTHGLFGQSVLDEYLQTAAENHPGLKARYNEYLAALEKVPQSGLLPDPQVSFGYFISPVETRVGSQRMKFSLSQMFPWFGTLSKEKSVAAEMAKAKFEVFEDDKRKLYSGVKTQYFELVRLDQIGKILDENNNLLNTLEALATQRFENNQGSLVEVIKIGLRINELKTLNSLNNDLLQTSKRTFNLTLGRVIDDEIEITQDPQSIDQLVDPNASMDQHPTLKNLTHQINSYDELIGLTKLQAKPRFGFGIDYVVTDQRNDIAVPNNGQNALMPMVTMSLPIFGKKYKAITKEAELMKQARQNEFDNGKLSLLTDYENKLFELKKARKNLELYESQISETQNAIDLLLTAYTTDKAGFEDLLEMQEQQLNYQTSWQNAFKDLNASLAEIEYLTGNEN